MLHTYVRMNLLMLRLVLHEYICMYVKDDHKRLQLELPSTVEEGSHN